MTEPDHIDYLSLIAEAEEHKGDPNWPHCTVCGEHPLARGFTECDVCMSTPKPSKCLHDSKRSDGWLDNHCLNCGADGYWEEGQQITDPTGRERRAHPSGKTLLAPLREALYIMDDSDRSAKHMDCHLADVIIRDGFVVKDKRPNHFVPRHATEEEQAAAIKIERAPSADAEDEIDHPSFETGQWDIDTSPAKLYHALVTKDGQVQWQADTPCQQWVEDALVKRPSADADGERGHEAACHGQYLKVDSLATKEQAEQVGREYLQHPAYVVSMDDGKVSDIQATHPQSHLPSPLPRPRLTRTYRRIALFALLFALWAYDFHIILSR